MRSEQSKKGRVRQVFSIVLALLIGAATAVLVLVFRPVISALPSGLAEEVAASSLYLPIGVFGVIRWTFWLSKKIPAAFYQPIRTPYTTTCSVITPVYQEDPVIFRKAIESWIMNSPDEIIAVIDITDTVCIGIAGEYPQVQAIITEKPGKRPAAVDGILTATTDICILVDSDVIFEPKVIERVLRPFADPEVGGVGTRQKVYDRSTIWQRIADMFRTCDTTMRRPL